MFSFYSKLYINFIDSTLIQRACDWNRSIYQIWFSFIYRRNKQIDMILLLAILLFQFKFLTLVWHKIHCHCVVEHLEFQTAIIPSRESIASVTWRVFETHSITLFMLLFFCIYFTYLIKLRLGDFFLWPMTKDNMYLK